MLELNLIYCKRVSFQQSEATNFLEFIGENPELAAHMRDNDVVCFISQTGEQYVFVRAFRIYENEAGKKYNVLASSRARVAGGRWHPKMIANYAEQVGIKLIGRKRLEEALADDEAEKAHVVKSKRANGHATAH